MTEVSESVGRYLNAIHLLTLESEGPASTGELADVLDVSPASVTEMLSTLEERDLATYEKYEGVRLTEGGETTARELMWKHCVAENFLAEDLDLEVGGLPDADARGFGHALSDEVADRLRAYIDHPCESRCDAPQREYGECRDDVVGTDQSASR